MDENNRAEFLVKSVAMSKETGVLGPTQLTTAVNKNLKSIDVE